MAKVTHAFDTFTAIGQREDLSDTIYNISPEETPFVTNAGKRSVSNTKYEWSIESLPSVSTTAQLEGDSISATAANNTTRLSNITQILYRAFAVTNTQAAMNRAGVSDAMAHQAAIASRALKRDVESLMLLNQASNESSADASTARATAAMGAWIRTNVDKASDGTNPTNAVGTDPRNDGTARALDEAKMKAALKLCYDNSGDQPSMIMVDAAGKQIVSAFSGRASATQVVALPQSKPDEVHATVSVYFGDFGTYNVFTNRFQRAKDTWIINPEFVKIAQLRPYEMTTKGVVGDASEAFITWEGGLQVDNESAHGLVADCGG
ncbi:major head protein [uncultured Mediterranean phage uvMED]|nr:major head protein [uncultured Mediterranean phage uvMED]